MPEISDVVQGAPILICPVFLTPNGTIHLGHVSGPYLGADIFRRYCLLKGLKALLVCGTDDHQSYMVTKATQSLSTPQQVADYYAAAIRAACKTLEIEFDIFTQSSRSPKYTEVVQAFIDILIRRGFVTYGTSPQLVDQDGTLLFEPYVSGICPSCKSSCRGNICEECGSPNLCVDLIDARGASGEIPLVCDLPSLQFSLAAFFDRLKEHLVNSDSDPRLLQLLEHVRLCGLDSFSVSHPQDWGVKVLNVPLEGHVVWVWFEMACQLLYAQKRALVTSEEFDKLRPEDILTPTATDTVYFFGYDNSFYLSQLIPASLIALNPEHLSNTRYIVNEFLLLDDEKFSTSRGHAIWATDILDVASPEAIRLFLSMVRPERTRTNFTWNRFANFVEDRLRATWESWLKGVQRDVDVHCDGGAPEALLLTSEQMQYWTFIVATSERASNSYEACSFSPSTVMSCLDALAQDGLHHTNRAVHLPHLKSAGVERRTWLALQLAAIRQFMVLVAPIAPALARRLADALSVDDFSWTRAPEMIPKGRKISLGGVMEPLLVYNRPSSQAPPDHD